MSTVTLHNWTPGFVANRLVRLLRANGYGLAQAHDVATEFVEGRAVSVRFEDADIAQRFVDQAHDLGIHVSIEQPARTA